MKTKQDRAAARPRPTREVRTKNLLGQRLGDKGAGTRSRLLDATAELVQSTPIREITVAQIARLAKTSPGTFYVYFRDVSDAALELAQRTTQSPEDLLALVAEPWDDDLDARAEMFVRRYVEHWRANAAIFRLRNLASEEGDAHFYMARINAIVPLIQLLAVRFRERARAIGVDAQALGGVLLAITENISQFTAAPDSLGLSPERLQRVAVYFASLFAGSPRSAGAPKPASIKPSTLVGAAPTEAAVAEATHGAKAMRTRARLIEAAQALVAERPLRTLTMADIAKAAKISKATFYDYFSDTSDVVLAAIEEATDLAPLNALLEEATASLGPSLGAYEFMRAYVEWSRERSHLLRVCNVAADEGDARFMMARISATRPILMTLIRAIERRQAKGELPADLHPPSVAGCVIVMIERVAAAITHDLVPGVAARQSLGAAAYVLSITLGGEALAFLKLEERQAASPA